MKNFDITNETSLPQLVRRGYDRAPSIILRTSLACDSTHN